MNEKVTALLRTVVPSLWGTLITWLIAHVALPDALAGYLASEATVAVVVSLAIGAWYALWRWLEPRLPAWLVRIVLGSALTPSYSTPAQ